MSFLKNIFGSKEKPIESYADFWEWFVSRESDFRKTVRSGDPTAMQRNIFAPLDEKLKQIKDGFFFLVGQLDDGTVDMVFTADGNPGNIAFVEDLVAAAPEIDGWTFKSAKPRSTAIQLEMNGMVLGEDSLSFYPNDDPDMPDLVNITLVHEAFGGPAADQAKHAAHLFLDNYLGELDFLEKIDDLDFSTPAEAAKDLIPIEALPNYLDTRQALFVEKYEGARINTESDNYSLMEGQTQSGMPVVATINTDLLNWDKKASHPWMLVVTIPFKGRADTGFPDDKTAEKLNEIEHAFEAELRDADGYLNIGRQVSNNTRHVFFACVDFREPSRLAYKVQQRYKDSFPFEYEIYKDKYWRTVRHLIPPRG